VVTRSLPVPARGMMSMMTLLGLVTQDSSIDLPSTCCVVPVYASVLLPAFVFVSVLVFASVCLSVLGSATVSAFLSGVPVRVSVLSGSVFVLLTVGLSVSLPGPSAYVLVSLSV
jgi:hypothetical protein